MLADITDDRSSRDQPKVARTRKIRRPRQAAPPPDLASAGVYGAGARKYLDAGWHPLPVAQGQKEGGLPVNRTGRGKPYATEAEIAGWCESRPQDNLCVRMMPVTVDGNVYDVVGIDVDHYESGGKTKRGARQLKELEREHGRLPSTYSSGNRGVDAPSRIRFFLAPVGLHWRGKLDKDIDVISPGYRYAMVWPSKHPEGRDYVWVTPDGKQMHAGEIPDPAKLAVLPGAWVDLGTNGRMPDDGSLEDSESSVRELDRWWGETFPRASEPMCSKFAGIVEHWQSEIDADASSHDKITEAHWNMLAMHTEGHAGGTEALRQLEKIWIEDVKSRGKRTLAEFRREIFRSRSKGMRKIKGKVESGERPLYKSCACCEPEVLAALDDLDAWAAAIAREVTPGPPRDPDAPPSWAPVNLASALKDAVNVVPRILVRDDGVALLYPGKVHSAHGESESGKSWLALCATAERLRLGEAVLYLDFEDSAASVANRLLLLGVPLDLLCNPDLFRYISPEVNPTRGAEAEKAAFSDLVNGTYSLAVIDGVTESMNLYGLSGMDSDDVAKWHLKLPKLIARQTGAAVVCIDHVTKDTTTRNRWAQGSQHKMAALDGAAYVVEAASPIAVGQAGRLSVRVAKDRPGRVRGLAGKWRKSDRTQHVADLYLDSTNPAQTVWRLEVPADAGASTEVDDTATTKGRPRRILTWHMEQLSRHLETLAQREAAAADAAAAREVRKLRTRNKVAEVMEAESERRGRGKQRDYWRDALAMLVDEGFVQIAEGERRSNIHSVVKPYRQADDPLSDRVCCTIR